MSHEQDREAALERLLRRSVGTKPELTPTERCLDAEALAAWVDGTLGPPARQAAEAHEAHCARCQSIVAVMMKTADSVADSGIQSATGLAGFRRSLRWLVPLTGGALAAMVWLMVAPQVPSPALPPAPVSQERAGEPQAARPYTRSEATEKPAASAELKDESRRRDADLSRVTGEREQLSGNERKKLSKEAADAPPLGAAVAKPQQVAETVADRAAAPPVPPASAAPAAPAPAAPPPPSATLSKMDRVSAAARAGGTLAFRQVAAPVIIASPDPSSRWRITPGSIEHSTDGGETWTAQAMPDEGVLIAGAAPSTNVCWLVGRAGMVMLTTDARTWQRIAFPDRVDLTAVHAVDERSATVQSAEGQTFQTTDGGKTWRR